MRGKRSKAYKKLMGVYHHTFGFREPYQVLLDSEMIREAARCTMEIGPALERTLRGKVKPMITQCSIRHLYALSAADVPAKDRLIETAKTLERRKCNHHELSEPLPERECLESVVVITANGQNKHRYVLACQDRAIRQLFRDTPGVPTVAIHRSVMILEPMNDASRFRREGAEREKLLSGIVDARAVERLLLKKRKRDDGDEEGWDRGEHGKEGGGASEEEKKKKKKKQRGPKGPNPLSVKKKSSTKEQNTSSTRGSEKPKLKGIRGGEPSPNAVTPTTAAAEAETGGGGQVRKKRKRKHGKGGGGDNDPPGEANSTAQES